MHGLYKRIESINVIRILPLVRGIHHPTIEAGVCAGYHDEFGIKRSERFPVSCPNSLQKYSTNPSVVIQDISTMGSFGVIPAVGPTLIFKLDLKHGRQHGKSQNTDFDQWL